MLLTVCCNPLVSCEIHLTDLEQHLENVIETRMERKISEYIACCKGNSDRVLRLHILKISFLKIFEQHLGCVVKQHAFFKTTAKCLWGWQSEWKNDQWVFDCDT